MKYDRSPGGPHQIKCLGDQEESNGVMHLLYLALHQKYGGYKVPKKPIFGFSAYSLKPLYLTIHNELEGHYMSKKT